MKVVTREGGWLVNLAVFPYVLVLIVLVPIVLVPIVRALTNTSYGTSLLLETVAIIWGLQGLRIKGSRWTGIKESRLV